MTWNVFLKYATCVFRAEQRKYIVLIESFIFFIFLLRNSALPKKIARIVNVVRYWTDANQINLDKQC